MRVEFYLEDDEPPHLFPVNMDEEDFDNAVQSGELIQTGEDIYRATKAGGSGEEVWPDNPDEPDTMTTSDDAPVFELPLPAEYDEES